MNKINVLASDDHPIGRAVLRLLLKTAAFTAAMMVFLWQTFLLSLAVFYTGTALCFYGRFTVFRRRFNG